MSHRSEGRGGRTISLKGRIVAAIIFAATVFFSLIFRLWYLQIGQGAAFRDRSDLNRIKTVFVPPPRGVIVDRSGLELVTNRPSFGIEFIKEDAPDPIGVVRQLAEILGMDANLLLSRMDKQTRRRKFEPKLLLKDVSREVVAQVSAARYRLPGVFVSVTPTRLYPNHQIAAHLVGYLREVSQAQLQSSEKDYFLPGDMAGQSGIELTFDRYLRGQRGRQQVIVNSTGTRVGELSSEPVVPGNTIQLTIDRSVQQAAERALEGKEGAIIALDPKSGEILAMASAPTFNPAVFSGDITAGDWAHLQSGKRLINKAIQGTYPPGSVFKIFMETAIINERVASPGERVYCPGSYWFKGRQYRCHKKSGHGSVNLHTALVESCDVYFYTMGQRLGVDTIHRYAAAFGFDELSGIDVPHEVKGVIPSTSWKRRAFRKSTDQKWYSGETLSVSIGQGAVSVTPLQVARALSAAVNGGRVMKPILVRGVSAGDSGAFDSAVGKPILQKVVPVSAEVLALVRKGMVGVVNDGSGTGHKAQLDPELKIQVGGKTGTAQVVGMQRRDAAKGAEAEYFEDHAWFAGYAPAEDPRIVVVALVENGGHGGATAAPLTAEVMSAFFQGQRTQGESSLTAHQKSEESR